MGEEEVLLAAIRAALVALGDVEERVSRSQVGWRRRRALAAAWRPAQYLRGEVAPLVLTIYLPRRIASERFKEVVEPAPGRFTHHLELRRVDEVDEQVRAWLREAWEAAG